MQILDILVIDYMIDKLYLEKIILA